MKLPFCIALIGSGFYHLGIILNMIVINLNGGRMPVYTQSNLGTVAVYDTTHVIAGPQTMFGWLTDYISIDGLPRYASPGDYMIWGGEWLTLILVVLILGFKLLRRYD